MLCVWSPSYRHFLLLRASQHFAKHHFQFIVIHLLTISVSSIVRTGIGITTLKTLKTTIPNYLLARSTTSAGSFSRDPRPLSPFHYINSHSFIISTHYTPNSSEPHAAILDDSNLPAINGSGDGGVKMAQIQSPSAGTSTGPSTKMERVESIESISMVVNGAASKGAPRKKRKWLKRGEGGLSFFPTFPPFPLQIPFTQHESIVQYIALNADSYP